MRIALLGVSGLDGRGAPLMRFTANAATMAIVLCCIASRVHAQSEPPPAALPPTAPSAVRSGVHTHDGFFLRFTPGFGGASSGASQGGSDLSVSGGGASGSFAIGGAVSPSLVLCVESTTITTSDPTVELDGDSVQANGAQYAVEYLGVGGSYYLPSNLYLHGGIGALWMSFQGPNDTEPTWTDTGFGVKGALGKEWWVSDNWALGLAGVLLLGSVPDGDADWATALVSLNFSATYTRFFFSLNETRL